MSPANKNGNSHLPTLIQAFLIAFCLLVTTHLVPEWGKWYAARAIYRDQTDAFLRGNLALSHSPFALSHDLAWDHGAVHQVWGLGIPL